MNLSDELVWRGFVKDKTFADVSWLNTKKTFYHGIDGSADSLTIGNLAPLMLSRHLVNGGWKAVLLVGGATSLVGDPGGKLSERALPDKEVINRNVEAIKGQVQKLFSGSDQTVVNNIDWLGGLKLLDFLRDVGKNYSMTELLQRDFISERMNEGGSGISYAEFSYTLIQGYDYWHLHKNYGVSLQVGGSDQWGNMLSGVSLVRKKESAEVHALSMPLITNKATGLKFGKTEEGAVWLDPKITSPTQFYQFWINADDQDVDDYLKIFTFLSKSEIEELLSKHKQDPSLRTAQQALAENVTKLVHGAEEAHTAQVVTDILTGKKIIGEVSEGMVAQVRKEVPSISVPAGSGLVEALVSTGLAVSNSDARRLLADKAVYLDNQPAQREKLEAGDFKNGRLILRRGKAYKDSALVEKL